MDEFTEEEQAILERALRRVEENGGEMTDGQWAGWLEALDEEGM